MLPQTLSVYERTRFFEMRQRRRRHGRAGMFDKIAFIKIEYADLHSEVQHWPQFRRDRRGIRHV